MDYIRLKRYQAVYSSTILDLSLFSVFFSSEILNSIVFNTMSIFRNVLWSLIFGIKKNGTKLYSPQLFAVLFFFFLFFQVVYSKTIWGLSLFSFFFSSYISSYTVHNSIFRYFLRSFLIFRYLWNLFIILKLVSISLFLNMISCSMFRNCWRSFIFHIIFFVLYKALNSATCWGLYLSSSFSSQ